MRLISLLLVIGLVSIFVGQNSFAIPPSSCNNCHTMHNSFQNQSMANGTAQPMLLRYTCLGCHAMNCGSKICYLGNVAVPQVLHSDPSGDLAGGNFGYMTGAKSGYGNDSNRRGHNVVDIGPSDPTFVEPPGHPHFLNWQGKFSCAGAMGCHGLRQATLKGVVSLKGAHHNNISGKIETSGWDNVTGYYYRFLQGVKGYEVTDWQNTNSTHHNEYFGSTSPPTLYYSDCNNCHKSVGVVASYQTISNFCATCHRIFHEANGTGSSSPWLRHPTDRVIPAGKEFDNYTTYDVTVPVARTYVSNSPISTVTPGQDVVMCLSCHYAHAGPYPSILRWDYSNITAGSSEKKGCKVCHSGK